ELTGQHEIAAPRHDAGLDVHDVAAGGRVEHPRRDARRFALEPSLRMHARAAEKRAYVDERLQVNALRAVLDDAERALSRERADRTFELTHAGLVRVPRDDAAERAVVDREVLSAEPALAHLPRDEVPLRDLELLLLRVADELDR